MSSISLGRTYRFFAWNATNNTLANVDVFVRREKFDSNGAVVFESAEASFTHTSLATATGHPFATQQNTDAGTFWLATSGRFRVNVTSGATGNVELYLQRSTDGGTTWGAERTGILVAVINFTANADKARGFTI